MSAAGEVIAAPARAREHAAPPAASGRRTLWSVVGAQAVANLGFFAVIPFLAGHLSGELGMSAALVGIVLGVRTACQQGMFVLGGTLADRWGPRTLAIAGCAVRVAGFALLGLATHTGAILVAAALTGLGGALLSPSLESTLSTTARGANARREWFARFAAIGEVGALAGPALGALAFGWGMREVCLASATLFVGLGIVMARALPASPAARRAGGAGSLSGAVRDRRFLAFAAVCSTQLFAWNQLYFALPLEASASVASPERLVALMFVTCSLLVAGAQVPLSRALAHIPAGRILRAGFWIMAAAMLVVPAARLLALPPEVGILACALALVLGHMLTAPTALAAVADFAGHAPTGAYHGLVATAGGIAVLAGNAAVGPLLDPARSAVSGTPASGWIALTAVLAASALLVRSTLAPARARPSLFPSKGHPS
ncbi:MAG: MFS transporter [Dermabacter sp.]|nr:MFS transporter [Dermabacter sp.]